jgi:hypothetical protein
MLMQTIESKPSELGLAERVCQGERIFTLTPSLSPPFQAIRVLGSSLFVCVWLYWTWEAAAMAVGGGMPLYFRVPFALGAWGVVTAFCVWYLRPMVRPIRPELVTLGEHEFRYDPGNLGDVLFRFNLLMYFFVAFSYRGDSTTQDVLVPRSEVRVKLIDDVWRSSGQRLILFCDGRELEVGPRLTDAERVWLHQKIETWRSEAL